LVQIVTQNTLGRSADAVAEESASDVLAPDGSHGFPPRHDPWSGPETRPTRTVDQSPGRSRPVLLYIEDDAEVSQAMKIRLECEGIDVLPALNATEGYRLAVAKQPDAILCDYVMPEGDGSYAIRRLQENPVTANIPVLIITGQKGCDLRRRLYGQGARAYFTKPIDIEELLRELGNILPMAGARTVGPGVG
jgi:CheY-like chemotaxis protein